MFGLALPFLLAFLIGIFLIFQGVRGIPVLSDPKCAKCKYDLRWIKPDENRICPECGSDLTAPRAVRFGELGRRPRLIGIGCLLIALTFAGPLLLNLLVAPRMGPVPTSST